MSIKDNYQTSSKKSSSNSSSNKQVKSSRKDQNSNNNKNNKSSKKNPEENPMPGFSRLSTKIINKNGLSRTISSSSSSSSSGSSNSAGKLQDTFTQALLDYNVSSQHRSYTKLSLDANFEMEKLKLSKTRIDILNEHPHIPHSSTHDFFQKTRKLNSVNKLKKNGGSDNAKLKHVPILHSLYDKMDSKLKVTYQENVKLNKYIAKYINDIKTQYQETIQQQSKLQKNEINLLNEKYESEFKRIPLESIKEYAQVLQTKYDVNSNEYMNEYEKYNIEKKTYIEQLNVIEQKYPVFGCHPNDSKFKYLEKSINLIQRKNTILFSIDFEAFEFEQQMVTEIGISIYDPREQDEFSNMVKTVNMHIIVEESLDYRNHKFISCLKDCYLLNHSCVLKLSQASILLQSLVDHYLKPNSKEDETWNRALIGHNLGGDINWLNRLGVQLPSKMMIDGDMSSVDLNNNFNNKSKKLILMDTEKLFTSNFGNKCASLGKILRITSIPHAYLHNAGNDSYYTLQLLMKMCDIGFRTNNNMDDLVDMNEKIEAWVKIFQENKKILPMTYLSVPNEIKLKQQNSKKIKKKIVQTEFGGCLYYDNIYSILNSHYQ